MTAFKPAHRRAITLVLIGMFALIALADAVQLLVVFTGNDPEPATVTLLRTATMLLAGATAVGAWSGRRWAQWTALAFGLMAATLLLSLGPLLALPDDARGGLLVGAAAVLGIALLSAWHLRRFTRLGEAQ